jgi:rSAM/selenodomain-associated transferase 1
VSAVIVMAKAPVAGRVKTRLCPPCSPEEAARVAAAAIADTLDTVGRCQAGRRVIALEGPPGSWVPPGFEVIPQRGDGLGERLANACLDATQPDETVVIVGMDTPQLTAIQLDQAIDRTTASTAVLGPAADGGWWLLGVQAAHPHSVFRGIPMSTADTGSSQRRRLRRLGLDVVDAPVLRDIDLITDLLEVAELIPGSRTAAVAAGLRPAVLEVVA